MGNNPVNLTDPSGEIAPILVAAGIGAAIGGVGGGVSYVLAHPGGRPEDYLRSGGFWRSVGVGAAGGAVAGAVGWAVPALLPAGGSLGYAVGLGALSGSLTAGAGQVTVNLLTPCTPWHSGLVWAMAAGGVSGSIAGGVGYGVRQWRFRGLPRQLHHYATNKSKVYTPQYERILQRYGLSLDDAWNTELLPHQGRHPNEYHDFVLANMQRAANEAGDDVNRFLQLFERYVVRPIRNNPDLLRRSGWR